MRSEHRGKLTSVIEVTNVSRHGFWVLIREQELFLSFEQFPWFRDATIGKLLNVELQHGEHLHWPDLDVDLSIESIEHPERFPLVSKQAPNISSASTTRKNSGKAIDNRS